MNHQLALALHIVSQASNSLLTESSDIGSRNPALLTMFLPR